jgi:hypothetical protein
MFPDDIDAAIAENRRAIEPLEEEFPFMAVNGPRADRFSRPPRGGTEMSDPVYVHCLHVTSARRAANYVPRAWYSDGMSSPKPRIQVTLDTQLSAALAELGDTEPRSRAVRDLAIRGAEAIRAERTARCEAIEHLLRIANGEDDGYDFTVSEHLHATR